MRNHKPTIWLSIGLVSLTMALALTGYVIGLMPDGYKVELESRAKVAESLAVQLAGAANRNDGLVLEETLSSVVSRNDDVRSIALRRADRSIVVAAGDHETHWVVNEDGKSTPTHVTVPLFGDDGKQGDIEITFGPASTAKRIFGIPATLLMFLGFLMSFGFLGYFLLLKRALRQLDPGRVIPERVQKAFDTLGEGVIMLDEKERILLVNRSFAELYDQKSGPAIGSKINSLAWRMVDGRALAGSYPWHTAIRERAERRKDDLSLRTPNGDVHNFRVSATVITDDKEKTIGAIVTMSDMTKLQHSHDQLEKTEEKLLSAEETAEHQRNELLYLSSHDSLSGCLNRRSFMSKLEVELEDTKGIEKTISALMIDIDNFGQLNRDYGYSAGDRVLNGVAEAIKVSVGQNGYVGRFNGDRFCVAFQASQELNVVGLCGAILQRIADSAHQLYSGGAALKISIGVCSAVNNGIAAQSLTHLAEVALTAAKGDADSQVAYWNSVDDAARLLDSSSLEGLKNGDNGLPTILGSSAVSAPEIDSGRSDEGSFETDLTGFMERTDFTIKQALSDATQFAILQVSIGSFDYLTEALGEVNSQALIRAIIRRIKEFLPEQDDVVAIGDTGELLIKITGTKDADKTGWQVKQLLDDLRKAFVIDGHDVYIACNAGVAMYPNDGGSCAILVRHAASAVRRAIEENRVDGYKFYSTDMVQSSRERLTIESGIREALDQNEFELFFQPIIDLKTGKLSAAECLLRCNNKRLEGIYMDKIIDTAEKSSLIAQIDMWVLKSALRQMGIWCDKGPSLPKISINISAHQLMNVEFMDQVYNEIKSVNFSPSRVQIEVTETAKMSDVGVAAPQLKRLQQLGVLIALDDFGTGQASLTYLQRLHPDVVKIDRSFVMDVHKNHANATMVSAMTVMSHCLGLEVVVEGVETEEELEFLRQTRCDYVQGYLVSKPMPLSAMNDWMKLFVSTNEHGLEIEADDSSFASIPKVA